MTNPGVGAVVATAVEALAPPASRPAFLGLRDLCSIPESNLLSQALSPRKNAFD
jgi:hypothetical protein